MKLVQVSSTKSETILFILTNTHIVGSNKRVNITYDDDKTATATVVGRDMWSDIAVLKATIKIKHAAN